MHNGRRGELIPVVPLEFDPDFEHLYAQFGLGRESGREEVLSAVQRNWTSAEYVCRRAALASLLLGRLIDGDNLTGMPVGFRQLMFGSGGYETLLQVTAEMVEPLHSTST